MAHSGPGVQRLAHRRVHNRSRAPLERVVENDGPASTNTQAHERYGHPGPRSSPGQRAVHGFSSKKGSEPFGPVERAQELYGLATKNLESITS